MIHEALKPDVDLLSSAKSSISNFLPAASTDFLPYGRQIQSIGSLTANTVDLA